MTESQSRGPAGIMVDSERAHHDGSGLGAGLEGPAFRPNLAAAPAAPTGVGLDRHTLGASLLIVHSDIRATGSVRQHTRAGTGDTRSSNGRELPDLRDLSAFIIPVHPHVEKEAAAASAAHSVVPSALLC